MLLLLRTYFMLSMSSDNVYVRTHTSTLILLNLLETACRTFHEIAIKISIHTHLVKVASLPSKSRGTRDFEPQSGIEREEAPTLGAIL